MKKFACQYAIVRFLPYQETGEFANVGIVMACPETGYFNFRLLTRVRRITAFFEELTPQIYRSARTDFQQELKRIHVWIKNCDVANTPAHVQQMFNELIRPREAMMRFDGLRMVLTGDPEQKLEELFGHYVERNFATKEYQEQLLVKAVHKTLVGANLHKQYKAETLGNTDSYHARFPFVYKENCHAIKAIKPLHLAHADPAALFDHGWAWLGKVQQLRSLKQLPEQVLFPVQGPLESDTERFEMYRRIVEQLAANDIQILDIAQVDRIIAFARN